MLQIVEKPVKVNTEPVSEEEVNYSGEVLITVRKIGEGEHAGKWKAVLFGPSHSFSILECVKPTPDAAFQKVLSRMDKAIAEVHKPCSVVEYD